MERIREIFYSFGANKIDKDYLLYEDLRAAYRTGFSMQECENLIKEYGVDGKLYIDGFTRMILPIGFMIEDCDWHIKK